MSCLQQHSTRTTGPAVVIAGSPDPGLLQSRSWWILRRVYECRWLLVGSPGLPDCLLYFSYQLFDLMFIALNVNDFPYLQGRKCPLRSHCHIDL